MNAKLCGCEVAAHMLIADHSTRYPPETLNPN